MEVKLNRNVEPLSTGPISVRKANPGTIAADSAEFRQSEALRQTLGTTPEVRPEVVQRGQELIRQENYPPLETIKRISHLLAMGIGQDRS